MHKPRPTKKSARRTTSLVALLKKLVVPAFEEEVDPDADGPSFKLVEPEPDSAAAPHIHGRLRGQHLVHVGATPLDEERTTLRLSLLSGYLLADTLSDVLLIGDLLDPTPFHVRADMQLGVFGRLTVGCDLIVRADDAPLVRRHLGELLQLASDLQWFFPLRLPYYLGRQEVLGLEIDWNDLPHHDLGGFLDEGFNAPPAERTPVTLLRLAQGLGRWKDVLKQLCRWQPAIRAAKAGGICDGRYPGAEWISPSFVHSQIEGGDEIEAVRILGKPGKGEPGFLDWLRGLAFHCAGDAERSAEAFSRYLAKFPGDVLGIATPKSLYREDG